MTKALHGAIDNGDVTEVDMTKTGSQQTRELQVELLVNRMCECHWIGNGEQLHENGTIGGGDPNYPKPTLFEFTVVSLVSQKMYIVVAETL